MNNRWIKLIKSLRQKKFRKKEKLFIVQGEKNILELFSSKFNIKAIFYTQKFYNKHQLLLEKQSLEQIIVSAEVLKSAGTFQSSVAALAIVHCKEIDEFYPENELMLVLDDVRDPGNLGTIIRIADWFGIKKIICSEETADFYNPKVISASMGSFTRVNLHYCKIVDYFARIDKAINIYGAFMNGEDIHKIKYSKNGILVLGNESNGISDNVASYITKKVTIPKYGKAESLNVAIATSIICDILISS